MVGDHSNHTWGLINFEGGLGLLDSTSNVGIGGHLVVWVFWRVVSVGSGHLSLCSQKDTRVAVSGLAVHNDCHVVLLLGHLHDNLLRLGVGVLGGDDLGNSGAVFSVLVTRQLLRYVPGPARSRRQRSRGQRGSAAAFHCHNCSSGLSLVLLGDNGGADVEDVSIFSNLLLATTS